MAKFFPDYLDILKLRVKPQEGEMYFIDFLKNNLDDSFEVYFNPFLNGDRPDVIIMKENQGVLIVEIKDYILDAYELDEKKNWKIKSTNQRIDSPVSQVIKYKENLFNLHIEGLLARKISNIKNFNVVNCAIYFHNSIKNNIEKLLIEPYKEDKRYIDFIK